jgi:hypothetical protein
MAPTARVRSSRPTLRHLLRGIELCLRVAGSDTKQLRVRDVLNEEGSLYLSFAAFRDRRYLRMVIINPATSLADIERCVARVREVAAGVSD